jgi:alanine transaminase
LNLDSEIYSFHSISKGINGECGLRGGYMEITSKLDSKVKAEIQKAKTIMLCSNTLG